MTAPVECRYYGRDFTTAEMALLRALIAGPPGLNRHALSKEFCRRIGWCKADGGYKDMMARVVMLAMHRDGRIELPPPKWRQNRPGPITFGPDTDGRLLSPQGLERQCAECHGPDGIEPRPGRAADARLLLEGIANVRESLEAARRLIERVRDGDRRGALEAAYLQAEIPVIEARRAGHRFVFDQLEERLETAQQRTAALLSELVNPSP